MSITTKAVKAGIQGATSTAKGQVTKHYGNEIDSSPVSKTRKNIMHIGMQGAAAAGAVALAEIMMKAYDDMQKPQKERKIKHCALLSVYHQQHSVSL